MTKASWPTCDTALACPLCGEKPLHHPDGWLYHWCGRALAYCDLEQWSQFCQKTLSPMVEDTDDVD